MNNKTTTNIPEMEGLFGEHCQENKVKFSEEKFKKFVEFLGTGLYDWVGENLRRVEKK